MPSDKDTRDSTDLDLSQLGLTSRRNFLGTVGAAGLVLGAGGVLAACGGSSTSSSSSSSAGTTAAGSPSRGGTLKVGIAGGGPTDTLDANKPALSTDLFRLTALYDQLGQINGDFKYELRLAESMEPNADATEWTIRVKPDIEFHNGKTLTADDVIYTLRRILDPEVGAFGSVTISTIDPQKIKKLDERTVRIGFTRPTSWFAKTMSDGSQMNIVPVGYDPENPVGTGPFSYKSFTPGEESVFERFPNYFGGPAYVDQLVILDLSDEAARVNAMLTGQVDAVNAIPYSQIPVIEQNSSINLLESKTANIFPMAMRVDLPPFDDVRVRQAMWHVMDREQSIDVALAGHGTVANDLYSPYEPGFDKSLVREHDPEKAKSLLKEAGQEGFSAELVVTPFAAGVVETASVLAANAADIGVNIKVKETESSVYFGPKWLSWPFSTDFLNGYTFLVTSGLCFGPGEKPGSLPTVSDTHFSNPKYNKLYLEAQAELDETKRNELIQAMQKIEFDEGGWIIPQYPNTIDATSAKTAGWKKQDLTGIGLGRARFDTVYFTS